MEQIMTRPVKQPASAPINFRKTAFDDVVYQYIKKWPSCSIEEIALGTLENKSKVAYSLKSLYRTKRIKSKLSKGNAIYYVEKAA